MDAMMMGVVDVLYRSRGVAPGSFRALGAIHLHVDGGGDPGFVLELAKELERAGAPAKVTAISRSVAGPQREELPETYSVHTPSRDGEESFEFFSTNLMRDREMAVSLLRQALPRLAGRPEMVVEVERVVATLRDEVWRSTSFNAVNTIRADEVGQLSKPTISFEIHHAFDVDRGVQLPPIEEIARDLQSAGIRVGGWFRFLRTGNEQSYRSNSFCTAKVLRTTMLFEHKILRDYLAHFHIPCEVWAIGEQVLGIWRGRSRQE
jgi:hypothetical protein